MLEQTELLLESLDRYAGLQTWSPYHVQICMNGRQWLGRRLEGRRIGFVHEDKGPEDGPSPVHERYRARALWPAQTFEY
jgi:hypothetical protein